jgi:transposase-like protein
VLRQAADDGNVARVCHRFGISRKSFYEWRRRHVEHGDASLCDRPRTPHHPHGLDAAGVRSVLDLGMGAVPLKCYPERNNR